MQAIRRRRQGAEAWRARLARHADSGLTVATFCEREAIRAASFYRWRARLGAQVGTVRAQPERPAGAAFVDIGTLHPTDPLPAAFELRLDLGGGVTLQLRRG